MIILIIRSGSSFGQIKCCHGNKCVGAEKFILNSDCMIIRRIVRVENTVQNVYWIFPKTAD